MEYKTYYVRILGIKPKANGYRELALENLDYDDIEKKYIVCSICPNWETPNLYVGLEGCITLKEVQAGIDKYYDYKRDYKTSYRYDGLYYEKLVPVKKENKLLC